MYALRSRRGINYVVSGICTVCFCSENHTVCKNVARKIGISRKYVKLIKM